MIDSKSLDMKRNHFSLRSVNLIFLLCLVSNSIRAQKINLDTLDIDELNLYKDKAIKLRNAGMIITFTGVGIAAAGWISSLVWIENFKGESGEGLIAIAPFFIGMAVGIPTAIVGIPLWTIGGMRINKAVLVIKRFDTMPENSMALGLGITIRF